MRAYPHRAEVNQEVQSKLIHLDKEPLPIHVLTEGVVRAAALPEITVIEHRSSTTRAAVIQAELSVRIHHCDDPIPLKERRLTNPLLAHLRLKDIHHAGPSRPQDIKYGNLIAGGTSPPLGGKIIGVPDPILEEAPGRISINPAQDILPPVALRDLTQGVTPLARVEDLIREEELPHREATLHPADPPDLTREANLHAQAASPTHAGEAPHRGVHHHGAAGAHLDPRRVVLRPRALKKNR